MRQDSFTEVICELHFSALDEVRESLVCSIDKLFLAQLVQNASICRLVAIDILHAMHDLMTAHLLLRAGFIVSEFIFL